MSARWQDDALCREVGADLFFPADADDGNYRTHRYTEAKAVCAACTVRQECLESAMAREGDTSHQYRGGLWGGLSPEQRAALAKVRQPNPGAAA